MGLALNPDRAVDEIPAGHPQVTIAGFGRFGQIGARLLLAQRIAFVALETDAQQVDFMRRFGNQIYFGDPTRAELLRAAHADRAEVFVLATDDPEATLRPARLVKRRFAHLRLYSRAPHPPDAIPLTDLD